MPENSQASNSESSSSRVDFDQLIRVFNTAMVSSQSKDLQDRSSELYKLLSTPAFKAILTAVEEYGRMTGKAPLTAAEDVIDVFRKIDEIWKGYVFQEGIRKLNKNVSVERRDTNHP